MLGANQLLNAECRMRNAELKGWHWLDRSHSRSDLSITIPHSTLRIPHSAFRFVNWFNAVNATYRADLRELNELNFFRFDAKLEQRLATLDAAWQGRWTELDAKLEQGLAEGGAKGGGRVGAVDAKIVGRVAERLGG